MGGHATRPPRSSTASSPLSSVVHCKAFPPLGNTVSVAERFDNGKRCDLEAGRAKLFASEAALHNATEAMRVFGGYSYSTDYEIERFFRDAPLMCIGEGTNEIQRIIIARQLLERGM